jgi:aspartyl-tRNA(Asn)/glutamyl-tRNA(Gln) amidotransferase subunit B
MNTPPAFTVTRGWNDAKQITTEQRTKEAEADYRYFPEPDIPPLELSDLVTEIARAMPELPAAKRKRYIEEYGFKHEDARIIVEDLGLADFTENALQELVSWITSQPEFTEETAFEQRKKLMKLFSGWLLNKLGGLLADRKIDVRTMKITPENFAEFILLLADGKLTGPKGLEVLGAMLDSGGDPSNIMEELGASRVDDRSAIESIIDTVIAANPKEYERLKEGDLKLMQFFLGQIMKETRGNADHETVKRAMSERLGI